MVGMFVAVGSAWMLGVTLAAASAAKAVSAGARREFRLTVSALDISWLPTTLVARAVPVAEATVGAMTIVRPLVWECFAAAFLLILMFTGALLRLIATRAGVSCRCFGTRHSAPSGVQLARNLVLLTTAALGVATAQLSAGNSAALSLGTAIAASVGGAVGLLVSQLDSVAYLMQDEA